MCDCAPLPPSFKFRSPLRHQQASPFNVQFPSKFLPNSPTTIPQRNPRSTSSRTTYNSSGDDHLRDDDDDDKKRSPSSSFDFLQLKRELEKEEELVPVEGLGSGNDGGLRVGRGGKRQLMRRSGLLAKRVISIRTARSLGFVSQLWVDTNSWIVVLVDVRPSLLSGDIEKFLLDDISQVGDVVLVPDESVMENDLSMFGLDTLVSTYRLFVEDVLEVASDIVTVHEGAISRVQKITKGIWDTHKGEPGVDIDEYYDYGGRSNRPFQSRRSQSSRSGNFPRKMRVEDDDWKLPMDY